MCNCPKVLGDQKVSKWTVVSRCPNALGVQIVLGVQKCWGPKNVSIISAQSMMCVQMLDCLKAWRSCFCLHITLYNFHHCAYLSEGIEHAKCLSCILCQVCLRLSQFSQLGCIQYMGLCLFSLPILLCRLWEYGSFVVLPSGPHVGHTNLAIWDVLLFSEMGNLTAKNKKPYRLNVCSFIHISGGRQRWVWFQIVNCVRRL